MKRTLEEDQQPNHPKIITYKDDRIKMAVRAALCEEGDVELCNQPIILYCIGEDDAYNHKLAFWPYKKASGAALLHLLDNLLENGIEKHVKLQDTLEFIARKTFDPIQTDGYISRLARLKLIFGDIPVEKMGIFALVAQDSYFCDDQKAIYSDPNLFVVNEKELSPHLYTQICYAFC